MSDTNSIYRNNALKIVESHQNELEKNMFSQIETKLKNIIGASEYIDHIICISEVYDMVNMFFVSNNGSIFEIRNEILNFQSHIPSQTVTIEVDGIKMYIICHRYEEYRLADDFKLTRNDSINETDKIDKYESIDLFLKNLMDYFDDMHLKLTNLDIKLTTHYIGDPDIHTKINDEKDILTLLKIETSSRLVLVKLNSVIDNLKQDIKVVVQN